MTPTSDELLLRSSAVAERLGMPVGTLRVWERRYALGSAATTAGGHRLYSPSDLERLERIRWLASQGHSLASTARLDLEALRRLCALPGVNGRAGQREREAGEPGAVVVVGSELQPVIDDRFELDGGSWRVAARFESLQAWLESRPGRAGVTTVDALLIALPVIDAPTLDAIEAALQRLQAPSWAAVYGYAATPALRRAQAAGATLLRGPLQRWQVAAWLRNLASPPQARAPSWPVGEHVARPAADAADTATIAAPRFAESELARFANLSTTVACECPQHVAELLARLQQFEAYSARCIDLSPEDRALHAELQDVAARARTLFERALERVAAHEGIALEPLTSSGMR